MSARTTALAVLLLAGLAVSGVAARGDDGATMWTVEGARAYAGFSSRACGLEEHAKPDRGLIPVGLRGQGRRIDHDCGASYVRLDLPGELGGNRYLFTTVDGVSTKPPRTNAWEKAPSTGTGWMRGMANSRHRLGVPLDRPDWKFRIRMRPGESFEVLDARIAVVRTAAGREVLLSPFAVMEQDPLSGKRDRQAARETWERGLAARCSDRPITPVPPAEALLSDPGLTGAVFGLDVHTNDLSGERFVDAWLDPVGQLLERDCSADGVSSDKPCGAYWLDYSALGAWWPERDQELLATFEGIERVDGRELPRLRVLVRKPWKESSPVAPAWAGEQP